uniref:SUMO interacting motifs containing 1 n=1 Tax=Sphenodon punctatus TaxID=8508 RepID=A0A8D0GMU0_SPHPU
CAGPADGGGGQGTHSEGETRSPRWGRRTGTNTRTPILTRHVKRLRAKPIPHQRLSMVSSTIDEKFSQGTLEFLMDFVSHQYYPPKEIMAHVIQEILLSSERREIRRDAYMLLMKIQALHPADAETVVWDWPLLTCVMEEQKFPGRILFLEYVIQTLEDDFQLKLQTRFLHRSIARMMLSCDKCFKWHTCPRKCALRHGSDQSLVVVLLQRMLSIAVEVDRSPICNSNKIADVMFSSILNISKRCQREAILHSMECQLLRCKVLELIFHHSCEVPSSLPLSLTKILYFLNHFSLQLKYQDNEVTWQRWDEMLYNLNLLLLSYHNVVVGHLRNSLSDRMDLIIDNAKPKLQSYDITPLNTELKVEDFSSRLLQILGEPLPPPIEEKIDLLKMLLIPQTYPANSC